MKIISHMYSACILYIYSTRTQFCVPKKSSDGVRYGEKIQSFHCDCGGGERVLISVTRRDP
jgi:hypothetical protein